MLQVDRLLVLTSLGNGIDTVFNVCCEQVCMNRVPWVCFLCEGEVGP